MIFQGYGTFSYEPIPIMESNREEQRNRVSDNEEADMDEDNDEDNVENQRFQLPKLSIVLSRVRQTNKRFTISNECLLSATEMKKKHQENLNLYDIMTKI